MGLALWRVIRPDVTTTIRNSNDCPEDGDMQILYQRKCSKSVAIIRQCDVHWFLECKNCDSFGLPKKFHQVSTRSWISIFRLKEGSFPFATRLILNLELVWMTCRLPRPPYDPDLAPSNCHLFEPIKDEWRIHFPNNDDVITGVKKKGSHPLVQSLTCARCRFLFISGQWRELCEEIMLLYAMMLLCTLYLLAKWIGDITFSVPLVRLSVFIPFS